MLTNREISEIFEVQINTLYNWQKSKPKLYKYLQNADYNNSRNQEINILLDHYSQIFKKEFLSKEIEYLISSEVELLTIDEIEFFGKNFIKTEHKNLTENSNIILNIYDKIKNMNIIEKYILYKKIYKFKESKENIDILTYFKEFIK